MKITIEVEDQQTLDTIAHIIELTAADEKTSKEENHKKALDFLDKFLEIARPKETTAQEIYNEKIKAGLKEGFERGVSRKDTGA